jgi:GH15 family glucan-1,4-alpha-glucosidase
MRVSKSVEIRDSPMGRPPSRPERAAAQRDVRGDEGDPRNERSAIGDDPARIPSDVVGLQHVADSHAIGSRIGEPRVVDGAARKTSIDPNHGEGSRKPRAPALDHGVIGNGRLLALVSPTSAIEWLCMPRFDSPSLFASILDRTRGGTWRVLRGEHEMRGKLEYLTNTNVLCTTFEDGDAAWQIVDFAPRIPHGLTTRVPIEIVRILRPLRGSPLLRIDFDPRPDYARKGAQLLEATDAIEVHGGDSPNYLYTNLPRPYLLGKSEFVLSRPMYFVLSYERRAELPTLDSMLQELDITVAGWRAWARTCNLPHFAPSMVLRSALCLKLHTYHDTGAIIAATTTSIPEAMNTGRTWDYRYCWLRDAAFVVEALRRLSFLEEGERFIRFLRDVVESGPVQPVYAIDGRRDLEEIFLPHLEGFGGNGHVRIGNAAAFQRQNDLMGEMILCLDTVLGDPRFVVMDADGYFPLIQRLVDEAIAAAPTPDTSIWEFRTTLRHYTFSRAMCWAAIHRGASLARRLGHAREADRWQKLADEEQRIVLERGYNAEDGLFSQSLDGRNPDAANLLLPTIGIIDAREPRFVSTLKVYERTLLRNGLLLRYATPDDFGPAESAFSICSFWWAEALALSGRLDDAAQVFDRVARYANPLGLFSEDIDPSSGALLGNFPQAYTHVGLIHAAMTIGDLMAARDGKVRAWV